MPDAPSTSRRPLFRSARGVVLLLLGIAAVALPATHQLRDGRGSAEAAEGAAAPGSASPHARTVQKVHPSPRPLKARRTADARSKASKATRSASQPSVSVSPPKASPTRSPASVAPRSGGTRWAPTQPASLVYGGSAGAEQYAAPGGLVVTGRDNFADQPFRTVSQRGGSVLIYLNTIIDEPHGRYQQMLFNQSACGPAVSNWPGSPRANSTGSLTDFRPGSVLQRKLPCVLETMVRENPHMAGWFADDLGSRSWFPGIDWGSWSATDRQAYRDGAIAISKTFRQVADKHGLLLLVNGTWTAGSLAAEGGGFPDQGRSGNAYADGGVIEHHDGEADFFKRYACSSQWAASSAVTRGEAVNFAITASDAGLRNFASSRCIAYASVQNTYDVVPPWSGFVDRLLPTRVGS